MKDFLKKWKTDKKYQTKIKLSLYTLFVVLVSIIAVSSRSAIPTNELENLSNTNNIDNENEENKKIDLIEIPQIYNYTINIKINNNNYIYIGNKKLNQEIITKEVNGEVEKYLIENNNYYKEDGMDYISTTENEIYDIVNNNYLKISTINQYLSKSTKMLNQYLVYLKDIILGNNSEEYIIIELNDNIIDIDYTALMKEFDKSIEKYLVKIEIEEIE